MYDRIVVALDGSELAEGVLPFVAPLIEKFGASVTLLRAITPPGAMLASAVAADGPVIDPMPLVEAERQEAASYLNALAARMREVGLTMQTVVPERSAAEAIVDEARRAGASLIALTTHGRGGLGRLVFGSVADAVLRHAPCPVLLVRVSETEERVELT